MNHLRRMQIPGVIGLLTLLLTGCASYGVVENTSSDQLILDNHFSLRNRDLGDRSADIAFVLTFSGGGTRAAAMAYGVLEELRDTQVMVGNQPRRLLDEVDHISSVSGGSFAAAYYGLHGEHMFEIFEDEFLRFDLQSKLTHSLFNPFHWFGSRDRTERSVEIYQKYLFHDAVFADMDWPGRPMIVINASDLAHGVRFSFIQDYFNLLCSDLMSFPVARAVAASSAVPVVFNPIVVENYSGCGDDKMRWRTELGERAEGDPELTALYQGLMSFSDKESRKYIHFVDGGITDNMGIRAVTDIIDGAGGPAAYLHQAGRQPPGTVVFISVNASTNPSTRIDETTRQPSMIAAMNAVSGVQLHRYNTATLELLKNDLIKWSEELSTDETRIKPYFIEVTFEDIQQPQLKVFLNKVPTSFALTDEQVDTLTDSARNLLRNNPTFRQLLSDMGQP